MCVERASGELRSVPRNSELDSPTFTHDADNELRAGRGGKAMGRGRLKVGCGRALILATGAGRMTPDDEKQS